jgi:Protein of unknown function (DUF2817)
VSFLSYFSPDFCTARDRFIALATGRGFRLASYAIDARDARGPDGEKLTIDVALLGSPKPTRVVIVSSGLHGVEGFFGSATQLAWLDTHGATWSPPADGAFILVHAINPFGFAWRRRWNESNVDLNRNFLDDRRFLTSDPFYRESRQVYESLNAFLNPASPPSRCEPYALKAVCLILSQGILARAKLPVQKKSSFFAFRKIFSLGLGELQKTLPVGQYEHEKGLFYGGSEAEQSTRVLQQQLPVWVGKARMILHVDFHTGLGTYGNYKLFIADEPGTERCEWVTTRFGTAQVEPWNGKTAYPARGSMAGYFKKRFADRNYHCLTAEFGTYKPMRVLGALRTENRAHFHGKCGQPAYEKAKQQVMEAFCPAAPAWRQQATDKGLKIIDQVVSVGFGAAVD